MARDDMVEDIAVDSLLEAARGFLSAHQERVGSRVAPKGSQELTEPLREEVWKRAEPEWQMFLSGCKLSKQTLREMKRMRDKWIKQRTQPARAKLFARRKRDRDKHRRYIAKKFIPSNKYKKLKYKAKRAGVPIMSRLEFYEQIVDRYKLNEGKRVHLEVRRIKPELGFTIGNLQVWVDHEYVGEC